MRRVHAALLALLLAACEHSEPFAPLPPRAAEPFDPSPPVRLTYATGLNTQPAFSEDGQSIVYAFPRPDDRPEDEDHDVCLGVLPVSGGPRSAEVCVHDADHRRFRDGIEHGALSADGRLVFVQASGIIGNLSVLRSALRIARADSVRGSREVLELRRSPPGGGPIWDFLVNPTWVGPGEVVALAVRMELRGPNNLKDTVFFGQSVVRLHMDSSPLEWSTVAPAMSAGSLAHDRSTGMLYLLSHRYLDDVLTTVIADTVWRVPVTGGVPVPVFGLPHAASAFGERILAIAAGGGRLLGTRARVIAGAPVFEVVELVADAPPIAVPLNLPGNPGRLALSPDGRVLVAEVFRFDGGIHLHRIDLP